MTGFGGDGAAAAEVSGQFWCQPAPRSADQGAGLVFVMATADDSRSGALASQVGGLFEGLFQGMAIAGIARKEISAWTAEETGAAWGR